MTDPLPHAPDDAPLLEIDAHMMHAEVILDDSRWQSVKDLQVTIKKAMHGVNNLMGDDTCCPLSVTITCMNDSAIQTLNKNFRGHDKPTNVLSFPDGDVDENSRLHLGDIAIAFETLEREAQEQDKSFHDHFTHMITHGLLHLYGYDHETDEDAEEMESLEVEILEDMGIKNPYI